jgi:phenylpropionate dioxygenase-like ring-hydroxylating dioxygenase large terminal subunit
MTRPTPKRQSREQALQGRIRNIGKRRYLSEEWQAEEWRRVWKNTWQAAAHLSDLRKPGDFLVYELGSESVLITRTQQGEIRAFYNVCQHRGVRLVGEHCGRTDNFRCPYHSWRYSPDGKLIHAPEPDSFQEGLPVESISLPPVRCEIALGFAWIALNPDIEPLDSYLEDMLPLMAHYCFEDMTLMQDQTVAVNCNWKAVHDNFSELYHVHYLHPQHRRFVDCTRATSELYPRGHTRVWVPGATTDSLFSTPQAPTDLLALQLSALGIDPANFDGRVDDVQSAIRAAKRELASAEPYYNNFTDEELSDVIQTNVFPNCLFTYQPEMLWLIRIRPHASDPNRCYLDKLSFERFPHDESKRFLEGIDELDAEVDAAHGSAAGGRPVHEQFDYSDVIAGRKSMTDTIDQDLSLLSHAQQGMLSDGFTGSWLNEIECRISHFHEHLDNMMGPELLD